MKYLTTTDVAKQLGALDHQVRRIADDLESRGLVVLVRLGQSRGVPEDALDLIRAELAKRPGWRRLPAGVG